MPPHSPNLVRPPILGRWSICLLDGVPLQMLGVWSRSGLAVDAHLRHLLGLSQPLGCPKAVHQGGCIAVAGRWSMLAVFHVLTPSQPTEFAITGSTPVLVHTKLACCGGSGGAIPWPCPSRQARWMFLASPGLRRTETPKRKGDPGSTKNRIPPVRSEI